MSYIAFPIGNSPIGHEKIPLFDNFFQRNPACEQLTPDSYTRQSVARDVIRHGNRWHHVGLFSSRMNRALVPYESTLEKQACMLFESWSQINSYISQPHVIRLYYSNAIHNIFPDFKLITRNECILVDVKFKKETCKHDFRARAEALNFYATERGMSYTILTEHEIRGQRLQNAHWLTGLARGNACPELVEFVWEWLISHRSHTFGEIIRSTARYPQVQSVIASLALDGHLAISWDIPIQDQLVSLVILSEA